MSDLTPKQEGFCHSYIETSNASEAYRLNYDASAMNANSVARKAFEVMENVKVTARIEELRKGVSKRHNITVESILAELEEARQLALETGKAGPAVQASMGKAKLAGLDKQIIDHTSSDGTMTPRPTIAISKSDIKEIANTLNDGI